MLDDRAKLLLKALVERYIADGQPVGSRTLSRASGLDLSPATIRNVMQDLEYLGLLDSPHISAGRIPTQLGLRMFVDGLLAGLLPQWQAGQVTTTLLFARRRGLLPSVRASIDFLLDCLSTAEPAERSEASDDSTVG